MSSTEASDDESEKNICRDITRKRLHAAIYGYSWRTAKGLQNVDGLGGEFGYMTANRMPDASSYEKIQHHQKIWYTLQQIHFSGVSPYVKNERCQRIETETLRLVYLTDVESKTLAHLDGLLTDNKKTVVYSWRPGIVRQYCLHEHMEVRRIPEYLVDRFGGGAA